MIVEVGCGTAVPRLRWEAEKIVADLRPYVTLLRINADEPLGCLLPMALHALPVAEIEHARENVEPD